MFEFQYQNWTFHMKEPNNNVHDIFFPLDFDPKLYELKFIDRLFILIRTK